jgi:hypothetical protein
VNISNADTRQFSIDIDGGTFIEMSDIVDSFKFIPLQTTDDCIIGKIDKIVFTDTSIYVLDAELSKSVFIFDRNGNFKVRINRLGRGPGEYVFLNDFAINTKEKTLELLADQKIIKLDLKGFFLSELRFKEPDPVEKFEIFDDGSYLISSDKSSKQGLFLLSSGGKLLWKGMDWVFPNPRINLSLRKQFCKTSSGITFSFGLVDTIYHLDHSKNLSKTYLDFFGHNISQKLVKNAVGLNDLTASSHVAIIDLITETDSLLHVFFMCEQNAFSAYHFKRSSQTKIYMHNRLIDPYFLQFPMGSTGPLTLVYPIDVADLLLTFEKLSDTRKEKYRNNTFWDMYQKLDINDNPVLVIMNFKQI